jgi:hypothetical protein
MKQVNRREFIRGTATVVAAGALAACVAPAPVPAPTAPTEAPKPTTAPAAAPSLQGKTGVLWGLKYDPHVDYLLPTSWGCSVTTTCQVAAKS